MTTPCNNRAITLARKIYTCVYVGKFDQKLLREKRVVRREIGII